MTHSHLRGALATALAVVTLTAVWAVPASADNSDDTIAPASTTEPSPEPPAQSPPTPTDALGPGRDPSPSTRTDTTTPKGQLAGPDRRLAAMDEPFTLVDDVYQTPAGRTLTVEAPGFFTNDTVPQSAEVSLESDDNPQHGSLPEISADGSFTYVPNPGFSGVDSFRYSVRYPLTDEVKKATVTINVTAVAVGDSYATDHDTVLRIAAPGVLGNDKGSGTATQVGPATHGTVVLDGAGGFAFTPQPRFVGTATFQYKIMGDSAATSSGTATVAIRVGVVDAVDDSHSVDAGETLTVTSPVVGNDRRPSSYRTVLRDDVDHGTLVFDQITATFRYEPDVNFTGTDTFTYDLIDTTDATNADTATVTITVRPVGPAPVADKDGYLMKPGATLTVDAAHGVLANDENVAVITLVDDVSHGVLDLAPDGSFTYTPTAGYSGTDTFTYTGSSPGGVTAPTAVAIRVVPLDAVDDTYKMTDATLTVPAPGFLANDMRKDFTFSLRQGPAHGQLDLGAGGSFVYTPDPGFSGTDHFIYTLTDVSVLQDSATVTIVVPGPGDAVAIDDFYSVEAGETLTVTSPVVGNDRRPSSYRTVLRDDVDHGTLVFDQITATFRYEPEVNFTGTDTFTYDLIDTTDATNADTATVTITVRPKKPVAHGDGYSTSYGGQLTVTDEDGVLHNDTGATSVTIETDVGHGILSLGTGGGFVYTPAGGFSGADSFTYRATGPGGTSDPATVRITVVPPAAPIALDDQRTIPESGTLALDPTRGVLVNDSYYSDGTLSVVKQPASGQVTLDQDGNFTYVADVAPPVSDSFTYQIETPGGTATATVYLQVALFAFDDAYDVNQGETLTVATPGVGGPDSVPRCSSVATTQQTEHGIVTLDPGGAFTYTPDPDFFGTDQFGYLLSRDIMCGIDPDPYLAPVDSATVTITVLPARSVPVANSDRYDVDEDTTLTVDAPGVLGNDTGATGARLVSGTDHGDLDFNPDGSFTYTPDRDHTGTDEFTYVATNDGSARPLGQPDAGARVTPDSSPTTVTIVVHPATGPGDVDPGNQQDEPPSGVLPDTGSPVTPGGLGTAVLLTLLGAVLVGGARRRGRHVA